MHELLAVIKKELQQLRRDKKVIPAMIVGPIIQLLALGYAANLDVLKVPMVLVDQDREAIQLCREPVPDVKPTTFPVRLQLPEDAAEPHAGWLCRATVRRNEGDYFLMDLHRTRHEVTGQGRLPVRPGEGLRTGDQVLVRMANMAQGFWNLELDRRL